MPIRLRLALLFAVATAALVAVGGVVFVTELAGGLRSTVVTSLQLRSQAVAQQLAEGGGSGAQDPPVTSTLARAGDTSELTQVLSANGHVLVATGPGASAPLLGPSKLAAARVHRIVFQARVAHQAQPFLVQAVRPAGGQGPVVVVGSSLATVNDAVERVITEIVVGGSLGVVLAALAAWLLAGAALRPVERMRRQAAELSEHDADAALVVPRSRDEIAALARTLNGLLGRLHGALGRQRGFVSAAGHELRSPLAVLRGELELASRPNRSRNELATTVELAAEETDRLIRLAEDLLLLSRGDEQALRVDLSACDVVEVAQRSIAGLANRAAAVSVTVTLDAPGDLVAVVDGVWLRQMADNLLDNALRYAPPGSEVQVRLAVAGAELELSVLDRGPGFPEEYLPRAFERFSRSDGARSRGGGGSGLGLSIVHSLARAHGGGAEVANRPGGGAVARITLPLR
ncbi:MAG: sensor histidine kinase [Acidimicrobiales bacterium]